MFAEAAEAADVVARQFSRNHATMETLAASLRAAPPPFVVTCARGSSDHAATYGKYLLETQLGLVVASASPSVGSVYAAPLQLRGALFIVISQSGKSPDLLRNAEAAKAAGARVIALVNVEDSPLAQLADTVEGTVVEQQHIVAIALQDTAGDAAGLHRQAIIAGTELHAGSATERSRRGCRRRAAPPRR
ncbi:hypothetical protein G6F68_012748 [Rhizopus microsporus]|nr:hypothetical protein G6F68_012748 [Rhizopus microsporus]